MYELIKLTENDYYMECPAKVGLIKISDKDVIAIDSGSDKDSAKKLLKHIDENGWKLKSVYITHSHADHTGGNKLLQERTECKSYAPGLDAVFCNNPILEPMNLYGAFPFEELKNKFLMASPSSVLPLTKETLPKGFEIIELPGHSFSMVGIRTPDNNIFLADSLIAEQTLEKYGISYLWDVEAYLCSLEKVKTLKANKFIPSHAAVYDDITDLVQKNINSVNNTVKMILDYVKEPKTFEQILKYLFDEFKLTMSAQQYVLIGSTLRSYLAYLKNKKMMNYSFENNMMLWRAE